MYAATLIGYWAQLLKQGVGKLPKRKITIEIDDTPRSGSKRAKGKIVTCAACRGTGYKDFAGLFKCDVCDGKGKVRV